MTGQKSPAGKTAKKFCLFHPKAACSLIAGLILFGFIWGGAPRVGVSQQPNAASGRNSLITSPATSNPLISLPTEVAKPASLENKLAQGPSKRRKIDSNSENKAKRNRESDSQTGSRSHVDVSSADETAVLGFVNEHHAELADVLKSLKSRHAQAYARAITDLNRTRERLEQIQGRDEARYERELSMWKIKSRIQLLVVRIKMNPEDAALREEFRSLIARQVEQHQAQLLAEQQRVKQRLEKIEEQLEKLTENSDQLIERQMKQWLASGDFAARKQAQKGNNSKSQQAKSKSKKSATVPVRTDAQEDSEP